jgi:hypothetical protein
MTARVALIEALAADGLLGRAPTDTGVRVRLRDTPDIEQRTRELVAAESKCCAFLEFDLGREGGELVLDINRRHGQELLQRLQARRDQGRTQVPSGVVRAQDPALTVDGAGRGQRIARRAAGRGSGV